MDKTTEKLSITLEIDPETVHIFQVKATYHNHNLVDEITSELINVAKDYAQALSKVF